MNTEKVTLKTDGISIDGRLYLPGDEEKYPALIICHGIPSGSPPEPGDGGYPALAERFCGEGYATLIFSFRGTGESGGNLDMAGWTRDLAAAIKYMVAHPSTTGAGPWLLGFSAGAAVTIYAAAQDERVAGVAACACPAEFRLITNEPQESIERFRSIGAIRDADFPKSEEAWLRGFRLVRPVTHILQIAPRPLLLVHGSDDDLVPLEHARRLYKLAGEPRELVILEGAGHRLRREEAAISAVMEWLRRSGKPVN